MTVSTQLSALRVVVTEALQVINVSFSEKRNLYIGFCHENLNIKNQKKALQKKIPKIMYSLPCRRFCTS